MSGTKKPLIIGITGNIGSGKSTVSQYLQKRGFTVYYSDIIAHQAYQDPMVRQAIIDRWGSSLFKADDIDRKKLADVVFNNQIELDFLNSIVHPWTLNRLSELVHSCPHEYCIIEVPLLFEANLSKCFDYIILVISDPDLRISRIVNRDMIGIEEAIARQSFQKSSIDVLEYSDLVINNNGSISDLYEQVDNFIRVLPEIQPRNTVSFQDMNA